MSRAGRYRDGMRSTAIMGSFLLATLLASCDLNRSRGTAPAVAANFDYLTYNESGRVEIFKLRDEPAAIDASEIELGLSISTEACSAINNLCEAWNIVPTASGTPASRELGVGYLDNLVETARSGVRYSGAVSRFDFTVLPAQPAPAAQKIAAGPFARAVITADGAMWGIDFRRDVPDPGLTVQGFTYRQPLPFRTGVENVQDVYLCEGDWDLWKRENCVYIVHPDGSATFLERRYGFTSFTRSPLVDTSGQPVTNIRTIHPRKPYDNSPFAYVLLNDGLVYPLFGDSIGERPRFPDQLRDVGQLAMSWSTFGHYAVVLRGDGTVWEWSGYFNFNLGIGGFYVVESLPIGPPRQKNVLSGVTQVAAGYAPAGPRVGHYGALLRSDGTVWLWAPHLDGLLEGQPRPILGLSNIAELAVRENVVVARDSAGDVWQTKIADFENGNFSFEGSPARVPGITGASSIAVSSSVGMALVPDCTVGGTVRSWPISEDGNMGDGVLSSYADSVLRPISHSTVIGIGAAEPSCPRKVLFYMDGATKGAGIEVRTNTGNMTCDDYLCWEMVSGSTVLDVQIMSPTPDTAVIPHWDCEGLGTSFNLVIGSDDVYCKLTGGDGFALQLTKSTQLLDGSFVGDALGHELTSIPAGLIQVADNQETGISVLTTGTNVQLVATPAVGFQFSGWSGADSDCDDGDVTIVDRSISCTANFVELENPTPPPNGQPTLTVIIEGGPGAGEVAELPQTPSTFLCTNSAEPTTTCSTTYPQFSDVDLGAVSFLGGSTEWIGCDLLIPLEFCRVNMTGDRTVTVRFTPP